MLSKNSSVSRRNACRRLSSKSGNTLCDGPGQRQVAQEQPLAGEVLDERVGRGGSASIRRTWRASIAGALSWPFAATSSSSSSGMLLHRKNDSRDASSRSLMR